MTAESDDFIILLARSHNAVSVLLLRFHGDKFKQRLRSPSTHQQYIVNKVRKIHFEPDSVQQRPVAMGKKSSVVTSISSVTGISCILAYKKVRQHFQKPLTVGLHKMTWDPQITTDPCRSHNMSKISQMKFREPYSEALMRSRNEDMKEQPQHSLLLIRNIRSERPGSTQCWRCDIISGGWLHTSRGSHGG